MGEVERREVSGGQLLALSTCNPAGCPQPPGPWRVLKSLWMRTINFQTAPHPTPPISSIQDKAEAMTQVQETRISLSSPSSSISAFPPAPVSPGPSSLECQSQSQWLLSLSFQLLEHLPHTFPDSRGWGPRQLGSSLRPCTLHRHLDPVPRGDVAVGLRQGRARR